MFKTLFTNDWLFNEFDLNTSLEDIFSFNSFYPVDIPHDWMIYHTKDLYKNSIGVYKKSFSVDKRDDSIYILRFEGVYMDSKIYLNGNFIYEWKYGYSTFDVDLTSFLLSGENTLFVTCTYQAPNSRWYSGAGIYRNVFLFEKGKAYLIPDGVYLSTKRTGNDFEVTIQTEACSLTPLKATLKTEITDMSGDMVFTSKEYINLSNELTLNTNTIKIPSPHLWDITDPYLYNVKTELFVDEEITDVCDNPLGFRTISFDPDKGFFLNGRNVKINGVCKHHDLGALGAAMNKTALRRQFEKLIKMGVNSIRTSHNMPAKEVMNLADEMGVLIYSESFDMWELPKTEHDYSNFFPEWYKKDVRSWIRRDRNHPSLIIWGIGNEIYDTHAGNGLKWTVLLRDCVKEHDPLHNAYISIGSNFIEWEPAQKCSNELELSGYNYGERLYDLHHEKYPHWCIFGSETGSTVQSRGVYHFPYEGRILTYPDGQCSSLGNCSTNWGAFNAARVITDHKKRDFVFGQYVWTGWDYIGEPTPYFSKNSFFGLIDTAGFEKDVYYQYMAEWTDSSVNPMVHLLPYWDFNDGQIIDVIAYSNAASVELFLNNKSLGKQIIDHNSYELQGHWKVPYEKGTLTVNAYDNNGKIIATDTKCSFNDPVSIKASSDKTILIADCNDLVFIEISVFDENGIFVANARNRLNVYVDGPARLVGLDNGDSTDYEEYKCNSRKLFNGKLLAIISSTNESGNITVKVSGEGLVTATVSLESVPSIDKSVTSCLDKCKILPLSNDIPVRKIELKNTGTFVLDKNNSETTVEYKLYPENTTYTDIHFQALTKDCVEANFVKIDVFEGKAIIKALGDGDFILHAFAYNDKDHPEVLSTLNFEAKDLGKANYDGYSMVPGIEYSLCHSENAELSFHGGVFMPAAKDKHPFISFSNIDLGDFGSDKIHIPIFSFRDEMPIKIYRGTVQNGECVFDGVYKAKSIYNVYQENTFVLKKKLKGVNTITFAFDSNERFSLQGFYFEKKNKAYSSISTTDYSEIFGDSFNVTREAVTSIGNNVCLQFDGMNFEKGIKNVTVCGRSNNEKTSLHILFTKNEHTEKFMVEIPFSKDYKEYSFPLEANPGECQVSFMFLPGSNFDFKSFSFSY